MPGRAHLAVMCRNNGLGSGIARACAVSGVGLQVGCPATKRLAGQQTEQVLAGLKRDTPAARRRRKFCEVFHEINQSYLKIPKDGDNVRSPAPQAFYCAFWEKYLPALEFATSEIDTVKAKWRIEFQKWLNSMDSWTHAFHHFSDDGSHYYH
ncbi:unnamed protein product [Clavelina lepadiformis]|uniref:Acetylcholinesterase tetramerisation domain-containing protein n=1 Tax=Clavelina lepadiformis TaxID=159417 RepID=A0ABP0FYJ4_CLALP